MPFLMLKVELTDAAGQVGPADVLFNLDHVDYILPPGPDRPRPALVKTDGQVWDLLEPGQVANIGYCMNRVLFGASDFRPV